jgi:outer membrane immunogenic protein
MILKKRSALVSVSIVSVTMISALALAGMTLAADMAAPRYVKAPPPLDPPAWAGWYMGLQGGAAQIESTFSDLGPANLLNGGDYGISRTGGALGGNAGYSWQSANIVYGLESDINWVSARASQTYFGGGGYQTGEVTWMGSFRGRIGVDYMATLFYVTGGVAYGGVNNSVTARGESLTDSKTRVGWTAGVGVEHLFANNMTARAEVRYTDLGSGDMVVANADSGRFSNQLWTGMVGVGYKF